MIFTVFPKIPRLSRDIVVTEKIDGTNASIYIPEADEPKDDNYDFELAHIENLKDFLAKAKEENIRVEVNNCKLGAKALALEEQLKIANAEIARLEAKLDKGPWQCCT